MRTLPQKHGVSVEKYRKLYENGTPLDSTEDRIILYHIEHIWKEEARYGQTGDLKEWLDKMEEWFFFWTGKKSLG
jgi:hypothetical protein